MSRQSMSTRCMRYSVSLLCITTYIQSQINDFLGISPRTNVALECRSGHDPLAFMASNEQVAEICLWKTMLVQTHEPHMQGFKSTRGMSPYACRICYKTCGMSSGLSKPYWLCQTPLLSHVAVVRQGAPSEL